MSTPQIARGWKSHVRTVRSFLDSTYKVTGAFNSDFTDREYQLGWGKVGVDKFASRIIPRVRGEQAAALEGEIFKVSKAVYDAVSFGNSTLILDPDGSVRVSAPEHSCAAISPYGTVSYLEDFGTHMLRSTDGAVEISQDCGLTWVESEIKTFSLFYQADSGHLWGQSRITPSAQKLIKTASVSKIRLEMAAHVYSYPMLVLSGLWEEMSRDVAATVIDGTEALSAGAGGTLYLPSNPDTGVSPTLTKLDPTAFTPFIQYIEFCAKQVAAAMNVTVGELGITESNPSSAEALYASKEDLIIEISAFTASIQPTLRAFVNALSEALGVDGVTLAFEDPATPSMASQADAFVKLAAVVPAISYSAEALRRAGIPEDVVREISMDAPVTAYEEEQDANTP